MIKTSVWLIAVPDELCIIERVDVRTLMRRAVRIEARMGKGVNIEDEQRRYHILCDRMEYLSQLIWEKHDLSSIELGTGYLDLLVSVKSRFPEKAKESRIYSNFCPNELLEAQRKAFVDLMNQAGLSRNEVVRMKEEFYRQARNKGCHVFEVQDIRSEELTEEFSESGEDLKKAFLSLKVVDDITTGENTVPFIALRKTLENVISTIRGGEFASINFSEVRHDVIAEIMHDFVYQRGQQFMLPVIYGDGSKAAPFPIFCLRPWVHDAIAPVKNLPILNVGMMSQRHPELDTLVKVYWYRNQEISIGRSHAETDRIAYEKAKQLLEKIRNEGAFRIGYYQTGFQPAVVGFYRALTEELIIRGDSKPSLEVDPFYFMGGVYRPGKPWN